VAGRRVRPWRLSDRWKAKNHVIVRVLRARIRPGKVGAFNVLFRNQVPLLKEQPGLVYVKLARRLQPDGSEDVVLFEEWQDAASLYAWVGPNLATPRLIDGAAELIDELDVAHYEALDRHDGQDRPDGLDRLDREPLESVSGEDKSAPRGGSRISPTPGQAGLDQDGSS
jgi:quinol monooxygenase YgiN